MRLHQKTHRPCLPPIKPAEANAGIGFVGNKQAENDVFFYHPDHLGSTSYITGKSGEVSQHVEYIAFGEILFEEHSSSVQMPYLFNGKELDRETNLSYFGARYLDMKTSLWLNVDPLVEKTMDAYGYCYGNPIKLVDPDGKAPTDIVIRGSNNSSFTIKTDLVNSSIDLKNYGLKHDFKGNYSFSANELLPDAIGVDISVSGSCLVGGTAGLNLIWHTRGEKSGDSAFPELHMYTGKSASANVGIGANVGIILGWAMNDDGSKASNEYVANGVNWTGDFWSTSISAGKGWASFGASYFTARNPSESAKGAAWSGIQLNWCPSFSVNGGYNTSWLGNTLRKLSDKNSSLKGFTFNKTYGYMLYGNGSDYLDFGNNNKKDDKNVSGWHFLNPIDPKDNPQK